MRINREAASRMAQRKPQARRDPRELRARQPKRAKARHMQPRETEKRPERQVQKREPRREPVRNRPERSPRAREAQLARRRSAPEHAERQAPSKANQPAKRASRGPDRAEFSPEGMRMARRFGRHGRTSQGAQAKQDFGGVKTSFSERSGVAYGSKG